MLSLLELTKLTKVVVDVDGFLVEVLLSVLAMGRTGVACTVVLSMFIEYSSFCSIILISLFLSSTSFSRASSFVLTSFNSSRTGSV